MQLCQIHFYQKIARKKVTRLTAALRTAQAKVLLLFDITIDKLLPILTRN